MGTEGFEPSISRTLGAMTERSYQAELCSQVPVYIVLCFRTQHGFTLNWQTFPHATVCSLSHRVHTDSTA